jgi:phage major head subunit gpT-like protein
MDITAANLDILYRDAQNTFQQTLVKTPVVYPQIATTIPMGTLQTVQAFLQQVPMMRKWLGPRVINNAIAQSRTITAIKYEDTISVDVDQLADEQMALFSNTIQMFTEAGAKWPDQLVSGFISTEAATVLGYDGVPVYSTAHPILGGVDGGIPPGAPATQSNLAVSTALTYDNYVTIRQNMRSWKGPDGAPMPVTPNVLMVPPQLEGTAKRIIESEFLAQFASSATSNAPVTNVYRNSVTVLVNEWLSDMPNNWWLLDTGSAIKPFAFYQRLPVTMTALVNPTDANVFMNDKLIWGLKARGAASETVWWKSYAATSEAAYYPA